MKKLFFISILILLILAVALVGYGAFLNYKDEKHISEQLENRSLQIKGYPVKKRQIKLEFEQDAIRLYSENMTDAVSLIDGRIKECFVKKNSVVKKGDLLFRIENEQIPLQIQQANSQIRKIKASVAQAANNFQRQERLMSKNATSKEKFEEAAAQYNAAKEELIEVETQLKLYLLQQEKLEIKSPVDGSVLLIYQQESSYVQPGTPLALIGNFDKLLFSMPLEEESSQYLSLGDLANLKFVNTNFPKAYDTEYSAGNKGRFENFKAKLIEITPSSDKPAEIRRVIWEVDNHSHLLEPLTYNTVFITTDKSYEGLCIPLSCLADSSYDAAFAWNPEKKAIEKRDIKTGSDDGTYIEVFSGLKEGELVVDDEYSDLKGVKIEVLPENGELK